MNNSILPSTGYGHLTCTGTATLIGTWTWYGCGHLFFFRKNETITHIDSSSLVCEVDLNETYGTWTGYGCGTLTGTGTLTLKHQF